MLFIPIRILDIIDILLVAFLLHQLYMLIRGTAAINIFIGIFAVYVLWLIVRSFNMHLLSSILGQVIGVGVIALIIVFQQEIRRFLLLIGSEYLNKQRFSFQRILSMNIRTQIDLKIKSIVKACINMSAKKTGALIVISRKSQLSMITKTGDIINADTSSRLIESIFAKNSPLHDGAIIITKDKIHAARCVLPVSENIHLPEYFGMRHRAALGITETTDAFVIVVSEERGDISVAEGGKITTNVSSKDLMKILEEKFVEGS
jgi:uncharacterized protein (TIGR00159 family)